MGDFGFRVDELFEDMEYSEEPFEVPPLDLQSTPLGSLSTALTPLEDILPDIRTYVDQSEAWLDRQPSVPLGLPRDQALALHLFLTPWTIPHHSLYAKLNAALRSGGEPLEPFKGFLQLLLAAFTGAPGPAPAAVWIGTGNVRGKVRGEGYGLLRGLSCWKTGEIEISGYGEKEAIECRLSPKSHFLDVSAFFEYSAGPLIVVLPGFQFKIEKQCVLDQTTVYQVVDVSGYSHIKGVRFPSTVPTSPNNTVILSWTIPASPASTLLKPKISAVAQNDCYLFSPSPIPQEYLVEVDLKPKQLIFKITTPGGRIAQTFNLPFEFSSNDVSLVGTDVKLKFPF